MYQTEHQKVIKEYFMNHPNQSFTAKAICEIFSSSIHKATIYRKLAVLEEEKVIRKIYQPKDMTYEYQYIGKDCSSHLHLLCSNCGKTIHLECSEANLFLNHLLKNHQFNVDQFQSVIFGICKECSAHA
ncbi:MAG: transcriptional repressor [Anaeroplasmataceae bacterium]|nr:transcriptional repressor [Anaeroplasmataceae bacterium]MDE5868460.1 transcriptional repressor [Anaeroplasmataceae bacterium]